MKQRMISRRAVLRAGGALALLPLAGCAGADASSQTEPAETPQATAEPSAAPADETVRGIWISYLDWALADFSSESAFAASAGEMLDNAASLGCNTVYAQVRPFGDALYESEIFPWSHLCTGEQGRSPGFDPLRILCEQAHDRGLRLEAWVNPYRIRLNADMPPALAENSLANTRPELCVQVGDGIWLNPALSESAELTAAGVREIAENYDVDGIHFDDYFYPTTDAYIDEAQYAENGGGAALDGWRRQNVTGMVRLAYETVKDANPALRFGISPQGNPDNNYGVQYSDVNSWIAPGDPIVDYICPQLYWGVHYTLSSGSTRFAFENILSEWLALPRDETVRLIIGLGAYRIGDGDGGQNDDSTTQWQTGHALADRIGELTAAGADGWALYRYGSLFDSAYPGLAAEECAAVAAL